MKNGLINNRSISETHPALLWFGKELEYGTTEGVTAFIVKLVLGIVFAVSGTFVW